MPIAELFLGALLPVLFERLASRELLDFARREGINKLLKKWEKMLISINQVLDDAEDRQLIDNVGVKSWLEDIRNLAYDIEDLLDEFTTKSAEKKSKAKPCTSKLCFLLPSCDFILSPCAFMSDCKMRSKIKEMDGRLKDLITQKDTLNLKENNENRLAYRRQDKPLPTTSLPESYFISREDERRKILKLLMREEDDRTCVDLEVIPIIGMAGVGKTALVQQVYKEAEENNYFDVQTWTCVSDDFDVIAITKRILQATKENFDNVSDDFDVLAITKRILQTTTKKFDSEDPDLNLLQIKLKENLKGKKFLVVLDDVWNEKYEKWTTLLKPFQSGAKGSKIILTTRNSNIASLVGAPPYYLKELSQDACVTLFAFHAFGVGNFNHHPDLEVLGRKIVEKCKGLPLAVKTLAGLLRNKVNPQEWEDILHSKIWDLPKERNEILPALQLSYLNLPSNLRRCFAYCAIFPKDYEIEQDDLIHWWIAEDLLEVKEAKNLWNVGLNYFDELISRSLFQKSSINKSRFLMHDLVNDLAKLVAGTTYFSSEEFELEGNQNNAYFARHASFIPTTHIVPKRLKIYHQMKVLRSFISCRKQTGYHDRFERSYLSQKVLRDLLSTLKYLRVLSLCHYHIKKVPDSIGKLKHLRHLDLSYTDIKTLPKSIVTLYNLEALMLQGCQDLTKLPKGLEKLINLKFLDITNTSSLRAMPLYIGNLVGLEMLSKFVVGTKNGSRLKEFESLKNLKGELRIFDLHIVREVADAKDANFCMKEGICQLAMQWSEDFENFRDEELEAKVLDFLCPHQNLQNLTISYYGGLQFPPWLGSPSYVSMVHLRLHRCCRAKELASLGQLSFLKELYIEGLTAICKIGSEFYGTKSPFPSLITLEFKDMPLWENWSHRVGNEELGAPFPCLEHLVIQDCPMLTGRLPNQLSSLRKLEINSCPWMDASSSIISLPSLNELNFGGCNEGVLKSLVNLTSLTALVIRDVAELTCLNHGFTSYLNKLERLEMLICKNLMYLWQDRDVIQNLICLKSLAVRSCPQFISFIAGEGDIELPSNLETMYLQDCINLEKLPSKMHTLSSLRDLNVDGCPKLVSFPEIGMPASMTSLYINDCKMLLSLPRGLSVYMGESSGSSRSSNDHGDMSSCLENLKISECNSLPASPFNEVKFLPMTLKRLEITSCMGVESLTELIVDPLQSLRVIMIWHCENLRSLPQGLHTLSQLTFLELYTCPALELECFPPLPPSISRLSLWRCPKIKSLPDQLYRLTCLQHLDIAYCENIRRFPDGGLPPQLQSLGLYGCNSIKQPVREWLTPLTSLQSLRISRSVGGVGEEEDLVLPLPSSLLHLLIDDMGKVKRLSSSLPPSLRELTLFDCPKLRKLPQDGLPPSLEVLHIGACWILELRCMIGIGCYWPLIREIPQVKLGNDTSKSIT